MAFGKKKESPQIDAAVKRAVDFEITMADAARKSERRAWWVAAGSSLISLALAGVLAYMQPLKKEVPYLVMVDPYAGIARLAKMDSNGEYQRVTATEAINRANVASYVLARESYDAGAISDRDWRTVYTMSEPNMLRDIEQQRDPKNPESVAAKYGTAQAIRVRILSVTPLGGGNGKPPTSATVRIQRQLYDKASGATQVLDNRIVTVEFKYRPELKLAKDADNMVNPLRFRVTNYRSDLDAENSVPQEIPIGAPVRPQQGAMPVGEAQSDAAASTADANAGAVQGNAITTPEMPMPSASRHQSSPAQPASNATAADQAPANITTQGGR